VVRTNPDTIEDSNKRGIAIDHQLRTLGLLWMESNTEAYTMASQLTPFHNDFEA